MRPRFMNRGSVRLDGPCDIAVGASMRPRFMNRGSAEGQGEEGAWSTSFNEAPIHESGKYGWFRGRSLKRRIELQ